MTNITIAKLEKRVDKTILDALSSSGFEKDDTGGSFCDKGSVYLFIGSLTQRIAGKNRIAPFCQVGFAETNRIYFSFMNPGEPAGKATGDLQVHYRHFAGELNAYIGCETEEELPRALERVKDLVVNRMLPCLEKYSSPEHVLQAYVDHDENQKNSLGIVGAHDYSSALSGLILARLYGREFYEPLKRRYRPFIDPLMPAIKEKALALIAYLDRELLPDLK
jgi:hypothetical protein